MFNSNQYAWSDLTLELGGKVITGFRGLKYATKQEKELLHGKGNRPLSIQRGNLTHEGEITLLQSELEMLRLAGGGSILGLRLDGTAVYGDPANGVTIITDKILGIEFTEDPKELKQNDKFMEVTLPFICLDIRNQVA